MTQNLREPQMELEVKPPKRLFVNNIKNTNKQAKKIKQIGHSKFMYTYTLRKELSVELGRRWVSGEERGERFGQLDKPCVFAIQGSYRGCHDGRPRTDRVRRSGRAKAVCSPLLGSLGGAGWGDRPTRIYTTILVLGLLL